MIPASPKQKQIIAILTKKDKDLKAAFVVQQTKDEDKHSTNDLNHKQANDIILQLGGKAVSYDNWGLFDQYNSQHKKILSELHNLNWTFKNQLGEIRPCTKRLSEWLKAKAPVKKRLLNMTNKETSKTIVALENMGFKYNLKR